MSGAPPPVSTPPTTPLAAAPYAGEQPGCRGRLLRRPGRVRDVPNVPTPQILTARNNGTNVRIPYARLVPMRPTHGSRRDTIFLGTPDIHMRGGMTGTGRPIQNEYDGLESGELA